MTARAARLGLASVVEPGTRRAVCEAVEAGGAEAVWEAMRGGRYGAALQDRARELDPAAALDRCEAAGARFVIPGDEEWPDGLADLAGAGEVQGLGGAPIGLWLRGPVRLAAGGDAVAVVGARASSPYGDAVAAGLGADLASLQVPVVSGGAYGIDLAAHRGALAGGGHTICVLACGVDVAYPPGNSGVLQRIAAEHLVVSELPLGAHPTRGRFLARNRIIAAITRGTVIVEAAARSGAKNTANWAARCGRTIMAVPGPVTSSLSLTPHRMIRDQEASLVTCADEVLDLIGPIGQRMLLDAEGEGRVVDGLAPDERAALEVLRPRAGRTLGEIAAQSGLTLPGAAAAVAALVLRGCAREGDDGYVVVPGAPGRIERESAPTRSVPVIRGPRGDRERRRRAAPGSACQTWR